MKNLLIILSLVFSLSGYSQEDAELTEALRHKIFINDSSALHIKLPYEPYVKVRDTLETFTNYRSFEVDGFYIIPIGTYVNGCRANYTQFNECLDWSNAYGIDKVHVGVISGLMKIEEEINF